MKVCDLTVGMHKLPDLTHLLWIVSSLFKSNQRRQHWHRFHTNHLGQPGLFVREKKEGLNEMAREFLGDQNQTSRDLETPFHYCFTSFNVS